MDDSNSLVSRSIRESVALLGDHARPLKQLSRALVPARSDLLAGWQVTLGRVPRFQSARPPNELLEHGVEVLVEGLSQERDLSGYLGGVAGWNTDLEAAGLNYVDVTLLWQSLRRALLPFILKLTSAGPDMELLFTALDANERAVMNVLAAAQIEMAQNQLLQGEHQRSVGRLTGGMAHALNNSIAIIVGRAQILEEQVTDEPVREELRAIQRIARGSSESLKRLQHFVADGDGQAPSRVDVNLMVNDVVQLTRFRWRDDAEASGIEIEVVKDLVPVPAVLGQPAHLRDALVELILNSVEAMPLGGLVTIRTESVEDRVQIAVSDQGEGMDTATRERAAEAFFTTKGAGHVGLGLTTALGIARKMGGSLSLASILGVGTTAVLSLPIAAEIKQAPDTLSPRIARWAKILVVDDEPLVRDVAARTFQLRGFQTAAADSGADAVRLYAEQGPFEVVLVDLGMPGMNGFETARAIKELHPRTIVILMTGWAAELDVKRMREVGIDRAIAKPFDIDRVIQLISEALAFQEELD